MLKNVKKKERGHIYHQRIDTPHLLQMQKRKSLVTKYLNQTHLEHGGIVKNYQCIAMKVEFSSKIQLLQLGGYQHRRAVFIA